MRLLRCERGGIFAVSAIVIPVFILLTAMVLDAGIWFTHKRSLQNRADAGALAAGVEYLTQLQNCAANPAGPAATAIADKARLYAGATGTGYNETINNQSEITVKINAAGPTAADNSDGGNPCEDHAPDGISPAGGIWTDVIARETNLRTVAGAFGINLPSVAARARVELGQITGVNGGLPFVNETGDQIECVWAQVVRARDGSTTDGFTVLPGNPIELTEVSPGTWTGNIDHIFFTNAQDDVAIRYYAGSKDGSQPCTFSTNNKGPLPHVVDRQDPVATEWLNVYSTGQAPGATDPPVLRQFRTTAGTCGGPGFVYTANTTLGVTCTLGFVAEVDTGVNKVKGQITVTPTQPDGSGIAAASVPFDTSGSGGLTTVSGTITISPNATLAGSGYGQDYTQVGRTYFSVSWTQSTGKIGSKNCPDPACSGNFQGETVVGQANNVQQATYVADPLGSAPMTGSSTNLPTNSFPAGGMTPGFTVTFTHQAVDMEHIILIRDSVNGPGGDKRTLAVWCGGGSSGASSLQEAIEDGCQVPLTLNQRGDSCATPAGGWPQEPSTTALDCIQVEQGNMTKIRAGFENRFSCTPNNWVAGGPLPPDGDPRWAYIPLTGYGRMYAAANNAFIPIEGFVRIYVTGWGGKNFAGASGPNPEYPCRGINDPPPRNFDGNGAQLWGHLANPITLDASVVTGNEKCNLTLDNIQCKPTLVR
jgi:hypothetical protein